MQVASRPAAAAPAAARTRRAAAPAVAAALSLGAAWVHLAYMTSHFQRWWAYGAYRPWPTPAARKNAP